MSPSALVEEADLQALVDGELDSERRRKVEDHLLQHPHDAALVESWRRQNAALRAAFEHVAHETPPLSLRGAALRGGGPALGQAPIETGAIHWGRPTGPARSVRRLDELRKSRRKQTVVSLLLALVAGAAVAGAAVLALTGSAPTTQPSPAAANFSRGFIGRAEIAFQTYASDARPVEFDADHQSELLAWLRGRVGFGVAPDLSGLGLRFLGGRIAPGVAQPAGFLLYEKEGVSRVGLYFERAAPGAAPAGPPRAAANLTAIEWRGAGMAFVLIGPLGAEAMQAAAERAAAQVVAAADAEKRR
jgi:anti-sigma factor RsiW